MPKRRREFFKAAIMTQGRTGFLFIYAALGFLEQTRDYFVPQETQHRFGIEQVHLPLYVWAIGLLVVIVFMVVDHSYREINQRDHTIAAMEAKLRPKLGIRDRIYIQPSPTQGAGQTVWIQITPECLTDSPVEECIGHLLRVRKWMDDDKKWEPTELNETLQLGWSSEKVETPAITLWPTVEKRLNVFTIFESGGMIVPCTSVHPLRATKVFDNKTDVFRFDIKITARDSACLDVCLEALRGTQWNSPLITIVRDPTTPPVVRTQHLEPE